MDSVHSTDEKVMPHPIYIPHPPDPAGTSFKSCTIL